MTVDEDVVDHVGRWLADDVSFDQASVVPAIFLTWCVNLGLVSRDFAEEAGSSTTRLLMRDTTFTAFFTAVAAGELRFSHLSDDGVAFARTHYAAYSAFATTCDLDDKWGSYDMVAGWLTARWKQPASRPASRHKWWRFWE